MCERSTHIYSFCVLQDGNDFGGVFDEMKYVQAQVLLVKLQVDEPHINFSPSFQECWELIHRAFMEIIKSAEKLPRVQYSLCTTSFNDLFYTTQHTVLQQTCIICALLRPGGM